MLISKEEIEKLPYTAEYRAELERERQQAYENMSEYDKKRYNEFHYGENWLAAGLNKRPNPYIT